MRLLVAVIGPRSGGSRLHAVRIDVNSSIVFDVADAGTSTMQAWEPLLVRLPYKLLESRAAHVQWQIQAEMGGFDTQASWGMPAIYGAHHGCCVHAAPEG